MKTFNIAKCTIFDFFGEKVPKNAIFGKYNNIVYICENFQPTVVKRGEREFLHYNIRAYSFKTDTWYRINTIKHKKLWVVAEYITKMIKKCDIPCDLKCVYEDNRLVGAPREKKPQKHDESIWRVPNIGYALNSRVITNGYAGWTDWR